MLKEGGGSTGYTVGKQSGGGGGGRGGGGENNNNTAASEMNGTSGSGGVLSGEAEEEQSATNSSSSSVGGGDGVGGGFGALKEKVESGSETLRNLTRSSVLNALLNHTAGAAGAAAASGVAFGEDGAQSAIGDVFAAARHAAAAVELTESSSPRGGINGQDAREAEAEARKSRQPFVVGVLIVSTMGVIALVYTNADQLAPPRGPHSSLALGSSSVKLGVMGRAGGARAAVGGGGGGGGGGGNGANGGNSGPGAKKGGGSGGGGGWGGGGGAGKSTGLSDGNTGRRNKGGKSQNHSGKPAPPRGPTTAEEDEFYAL